MAAAEDTGPRDKERVRTRIPVHYGVGAIDRDAFADNISEGGIFINTNTVLPPGTQLQLRIDFPSAIMTRRGEVVWAIQVPEHLRTSMVCGMGISFRDADPEWAVFFRLWKQSQLQAQRP